MNLPRLAIEAMREAGDMIPDGNKHAIRKEAREIFLESVRKTATMMAEQALRTLLLPAHGPCAGSSRL